MKENRVKGKIAFISGASSGIGKATAEKLAQMGVNLILCARRENILNELKDLNDDIPEDIKKELRNFSNAMNMNYIGSLLESLKNLADLETKNKIDSIKGPAKHIIPNILKNFLRDFDIKDIDEKEKTYLFQATLAKWHCEQKRYAMAYININEAIIGFIMDTLEFPLLSSDKKRDENKLAKDWLNMIISRHENNKTYPNFKVDKDNIELYEYIKIFEHSRRVRNEIAHSIGGKDSAVNDIDSLKKYCDKIVDLLKNRDFIIRIDDKLEFSKKLKKNL